MTTAHPPGSSPSARPRARGGLLDVVLAGALCWGVYASTPLGAIVETALRVARGQKEHPSWFSTFRGREVAVAPTSLPSLADAEDVGRAGGAGDPGGAIANAARRHHVDADALVALVAVRGACDAAGRCTASAPDRLPALVPGKSGVVDVDDLAAGVARAAHELRAAAVSSGTEAAVEALFVGVPALRLALSQAGRSALSAPDDVEVHAQFLSPGLRRGALQGALAALHVYRLRTLAWPGEGFAVTSSFGDRIHPVTGVRKFHNGTDVGMPVGTPLPNARDGTVRRTGRDSISGNYVVVDHGLGIQSTYCHLDAIETRERARVPTRGLLGRSGATGRVTGPHLHYVLRIGDKPVDAEKFGARAAHAGVAPSATDAPSTSSP